MQWPDRSGSRAAFTSLLLASAMAVGASTATAGTTPKGFPTLSAGDTHTCAIKANAAASCWGNDSARQATVASTLGSVRMVSVGLNHSCFTTGALGDSRALVRVVCFGDNSKGQTSVPGDLLSVIRLSAGWNHNCAIKAKATDPSGVVRCWGANEFGQSTALPADVGRSIDGSGNVLNSVGTVIDSAGKVTDVSAGGFHSCAVRADQTVRCWGGNIYHQRNIPAGLSDVTQVAAGYDFSCALKADHTVTCWGGDSAVRSSVAAPIAPPAEFTDPATSTVTQISAGAFHICVTLSNGGVKCWGESPLHPQTPPATLLPAASVSAGKSVSWPHSCSIALNGVATCWGDDAFADVSGLNQADFGPLMTASITGPVAGVIDFGTVAAGGSSSSFGVSVANTSPSWIPNALKVTGITTSAPAPATNPFSAAHGTCDSDISTGSSCAFFMYMTPKPWQRGPFTGTLTVNDLASGSPRTFTLKGTAIAPSSFVLTNGAATVTPTAVNLTWDTSDVSTVTITATPSTPGGKATVLATLKKQPAAALKFAWNRKIGKVAAAKGAWVITISGTAANGPASTVVPVTLN